MRAFHTLGRTSVAFDDFNLLSSGGLDPVLAEHAGPRELADEHLSVLTDKGANAGLTVASLVAGMVSGADSIDDMAVLRDRGMGPGLRPLQRALDVGSFVRVFTFGHVRHGTVVRPLPAIPSPAGAEATVGAAKGTFAGHPSSHRQFLDRHSPTTTTAMPTARTRTNTSEPSQL